MQNKNDWKLFAALTAWALLPSVYLLVRMHIVAANSVDINILGQLEWFDLIDEVLVTTLTVPLYSLLKPKNAGASAARNTVAFLLSFCVYSLFAVFVALHVGSIAAYMNAEAATQFLLLQTGAMLIAFVSTFGVNDELIVVQEFVGHEHSHLHIAATIASQVDDVTFGTFGFERTHCGDKFIKCGATELVDLDVASGLVEHVTCIHRVDGDIAASDNEIECFGRVVAFDAQFHLSAIVAS